MLELTNNFFGIKSYYASEERLLCVSKQDNNSMSFKYFQTKPIKELWTSELDFSSSYILFEMSDFFLGYQTNQRIFKLSKINGATRVHGINFVPEVQIGESLVGRYTSDSKEKFISKLECRTFDVENYITDLYKIIGASQDKILFVKPGIGNVIYCFDLKARLLLWTKDIIYPFNGFLYFIHDRFVINTTGGIFLSLDSLTGNILWQLDEMHYLKVYGETLYSLGATSYLEVNSKDGKIIKEVNLENQYEILQIQNSAASYSIDQNYLYFNDVRRAKIGVLEKTTAKIIWTFKLQVKDGVIIPARNIPKVFGDKMYVLDSEDTLHIFSKL